MIDIKGVVQQDRFKDVEWQGKNYRKKPAKDGKKETETYNSRDSLVVTHPTTNRPACGLNAVNTWVGALAG
jgi:hypothetical protein